MISSCRNAETVWKNFHGVRLLCFDKDAVSINDFLGGATIKLEDLNEPSIGTQQIKLPLKSRKGKDDGVTGYIIVESSFIEYPKDPELEQNLEENKKPSERDETEDLEKKNDALDINDDRNADINDINNHYDQ